MSSRVVSKVLQAGVLEENNVDQLLNDVRKRVGEIRSDVCVVAEEKYLKDIPKWIINADGVVKNIKIQANDIEGETDRVRNLLRDWDEVWNAENVKSMQDELATADTRLKKLRPLAEVYAALEKLESIQQRQKRDYSKRADLISILDASLRSLLAAASAEKEKRKTDTTSATKDDFYLQESILKTLRDELVVARESLTYDLYEEWAETFRWDTDRDNVNRFFVNVGSRFQEVVSALEMVDLLEKKMDHLGKCVISYLFIPLLNEGGAELRIVASDAEETRTEVMLTKSAAANQQKSSPVEGLEKCCNIFQLIKDKLSVPINSETTFSRRLVEGNILKPLKEFIVESVLKPVVPSDASETSKFDQLFTSCDDFLRKLKSMDLIAEENASFTNFAANVDVIFLAKRCQTILDRANRLIAADLHNTVQVGGESKQSDERAILDKCRETATGDGGRIERETTPLRFDSEKPLPPLGEFPRCRVSESVAALLELIVKTLNEAATSSKPLASARFYYCARSMVEMYLDLSPVRHGQQLKMVPQVTAVFYNNCYFLCHHLLALGSTYESKLLPIIGVPANIVAITFIDFIPRLKEMAAEFMDGQVQMQIRYLIDCLKPTEGFINASNVACVNPCRKAIKACAMQFQHVHRVWRQVLAPAVLLKLQGTLGSELLTHVVESVVRLEDIAEEDTKIMDELFKELLAEIDSCFVVDKVPYTHRYCEKGYYKFKELLFVLDASLADIEDRWAEGKGPLADWMDALDVKQLIRALFQNTEKRAKVISKIK